MDDFRAWITIALAALGGVVSGLFGAMGFAVRQDRRISSLETAVESLSKSAKKSAENNERLIKVETLLEQHQRSMESFIATQVKTTERFDDKLDRLISQGRG